MPRSRLTCRWDECGIVHSNAELLLEHISEEHVGRRAKSNLCLQCHWAGCEVQAAKRDHLISHLRVHVPLKPHRCSVCRKAFKRPQDLKKHERIHTEEHKASLMSRQPGYKVVRRRKHNLSPIAHKIVTQTAAPSPSSAQSGTVSLSHDFAPVKLRSATSCNWRSDSDGSYSPTDSSSKHSDGASDSEMATVPQDKSQTDHTSGSPPSTLGSDPLNELFHDVITHGTLQPEYDSVMMDRLNSLSAIVQQQPADWVAPLEDANGLNILQNWLEQLSANIQTGVCIYPNVMSSSTGMPYGDGAVDMDGSGMVDPKLLDQTLYPSTDLHMNGEWHGMLSEIHNPYAQGMVKKEAVSPNPASETLSGASTSLSHPSNLLEASFWTPGNSADITFESIDGPSPSEAVDFTPTPKVDHAPHPIHAFETAKQDHDAMEIVKPKKVWYEDKREMMSMMNAMKEPPEASSGSESEPQTEPHAKAAGHDAELPERGLGAQEDQAAQESQPAAQLAPAAIASESTEREPQEQTPTKIESETTETAKPRPRIRSILWSNVEKRVTESRENPTDTVVKDNGKSPYEELNVMLQHLSVDEKRADKASVEESRKVHAKIVDSLWDAVYRARKQRDSKHPPRLTMSRSLAFSTPASLTV